MQFTQFAKIELKVCFFHLFSSLASFVQVAWVRVDTQTILSIHHNLITQNHRISLTHNDHRSWYLHIKEVEEDDRGWFVFFFAT